MLELYQNIKNYRLQSGMTQTELAHKMGYADKSMISRIENGKVDLPQSQIMKFAEVFNVDPGTLMGIDGTSPDANSFKPGEYRIPIVATIAAGYPILSSDNIEGYIDYDKDPGNHVMAVKIQGDSMMPDIHSGDLVVIDTDASWESGDIVAVRVNGCEGTCKRIKRYEDGLSLISINPNYEPKYFSAKEVKELPVEVVGKVVQLRREL